MIKLKRLTAGDEYKIGEIIADSFADDPVNQWVLGSVESMKQYYRIVAKKLYLPKGLCFIDNEFRGGAMWLPAGVDKNIPIWNSLDIAWNMVKLSGVLSIFRGLAFENMLQSSKPNIPHLYLFVIGTPPEFRGLGIGHSLMMEGINYADKHNLATYLESSKEENIAFYQKYDFYVVEKVQPTKSSPPLWLMIRDAKPE